MDERIEIIDFGLSAGELHAMGLKGDLQDFSSETLHAHPFHQVLQIKNGVALLQDGRGKRPQYGHTVAFIPAHAPHRTEVIGESVTYQSLYLNKDLFKPEYASIVVFRMSSLGLALLEYLNNEGSMQNLAGGIPGDCVALLVKVLVGDMGSGASPVVLPEPRAAINRALCRYMEENYTKRLTSQDFARTFPFSFRQLSRVFKSEMGLTIFEYLKLFRMVEASILLNTTEMKVIAVALECGYDSVSSFFTDFRGTFGLSPGDFRRRHR